MLTKAELQHLRSLREKKRREEAGLFVVEGEKVIGELLMAGFAFEKIYATAPWSPPSGAGTPATLPPRVVLTDDEMARASHFPTPSTVLATGRVQRASLSAGALDHGLTLALDRVQDAGNVGTLLRVADWFGLDRVLLSPDCADLFHQKTINASMGSFARVKAFTTDLSSALSAAKVPLLGCVLDGDEVHQLPAIRDAVIVIGSEGQGLSRELLQLVTHRVTIPRFGSAESLNAGIAAAIVCDNLRRLTSR